jgi:hypothetical protein
MRCGVHVLEGRSAKDHDENLTNLSDEGRDSSIFTALPLRLFAPSFSRHKARQNARQITRHLKSRNPDVAFKNLVSRDRPTPPTMLAAAVAHEKNSCEEN